jgi:hypothetical protein
VLAEKIGVSSLQEWLKAVHNPQTIDDARTAWKSAKRLAVVYIHAIAAQSAAPVIDLDARQTSPFRAGKDSADGQSPSR